MRALERAWYQGAKWVFLLAPLSFLYRIMVLVRRFLLQLRTRETFPAPVVIVGNIAVGGTGKTPLIIALAHRLQAVGKRPGIVSRGYGGVEGHAPVQIDSSHGPSEVGDEPRLIADSTHCPVVVCPNRVNAVQHLLKYNDCDVILCDDGLQHYRLHRDVEIALIDGTRGVGNGWCLPVGPLREPPSRLREVDVVIVNGTGYEPETNFFSLQLKAARYRQLATGREVSLDDWSQGKQVHAVAGIANPFRFQRTLRQLGFSVILHAFPDHYDFKLEDLSFDDKLPVIMTAKDAVKCQGFVGDHKRKDCGETGLDSANVWVLDVEAELPEPAWDALLERIN